MYCIILEHKIRQNLVINSKSVPYWFCRNGFLCVCLLGSPKAIYGGQSMTVTDMRQLALFVVIPLTHTTLPLNILLKLHFYSEGVNICPILVDKRDRNTRGVAMLKIVASPGLAPRVEEESHLYPASQRLMARLIGSPHTKFSFRKSESINLKTFIYF